MRMLLGLLLAFGAATTVTQAANHTVFELVAPNGLTQIQLVLGVMASTGGGAAMDALKGDEPITLFAVRDPALNAMRGLLTVQQLFELAPSVLETHIVRGRYNSSTLAGMVDQQLETLLGTHITVVSSNGPVGLALADDRGRHVDISASVDIMADNGVMHILTNMLYSPLMYENYPELFKVTPPPPPSQPPLPPPPPSPPSPSPPAQTSALAMSPPPMSAGSRVAAAAGVVMATAMVVFAL
jgi:uncharacterized surface protein with fasciclin (FAS1) repeats